MGKQMTIVNFETDIEKPNKKRVSLDYLLIGAQLDYFMDKYYLRGRDKKVIPFINALCSINNGSIFYCKKSQKTIFDRFGSGISLYFIFLKTIMVFLFLASILSLYLISKNFKSKDQI